MIYDKFDNLYIKIIQRLESDDVETNNDTISLKEVKEACNSGLKKYNLHLIEDLPIMIKRINSRSRNDKFPYIGKDYSTLTNIKSYVLEDGSPYVRYVFLKDNRLNYILFTINENNEVIIDSTSFKNGEDKKVLEKNMLDIYSLLVILKSFVEEYPGIEYSWDKDHRNTLDQSIPDGTFISEIYLNHPDKTYLGLNNLADITTATTRSDKYGHLYDYLDMYQNSYMKKTAININNLNPFIKELVSKYLSQKQETTRKLVK